LLPRVRSLPTPRLFLSTPRPRSLSPPLTFASHLTLVTRTSSTHSFLSHTTLHLLYGVPACMVSRHALLFLQALAKSCRCGRRAHKRTHAPARYSAYGRTSGPPSRHIGDDWKCEPHHLPIPHQRHAPASRNMALPSAWTPVLPPVFATCSASLRPSLDNEYADCRWIR